MIAFISLCYASIYILIFNKFKLLPKTTPNVSAFIGVGVVLIASIIFAWYTFAPMSSDARVTRYIIPIVPNVKGQLIDVSVTHMQRVNKGDLLYQIDPAPYQHKVDELTARIEQQSAERDLNRANLERARELVAKKAASQYEQDIWEAKYAASSAAIAATEATLENARWQLNETTVLAPANGFPVNVQLRPGSYVTSMPAASALAFVSTRGGELELWVMTASGGEPQPWIRAGEQGPRSMKDPDWIAADWVAGDASPVAIAAAVRTNFAIELARIDANISGANTTTPLSASGIRTAVGLTSANLATLIAALQTISDKLDSTPVTPAKIPEAVLKAEAKKLDNIVKSRQKKK